MKVIQNKEIPLSDIIPCPLLVDREDMGNIDDITGVIFTPIIVRPSKSHKGKYERITGYRRLKKAEKDKKKTISCAIFDDMTDEEAILVHVKENLQRKDLSAIEEGREYANMLEKLEKIRGKRVTQEELAKILTSKGNKTSQASINNKMRLLKLAKPLQNYLVLNKLGFYNALLLLQINDDDLQIDIGEEAIRGNYSTQRLKNRIDRLKEELKRNKAVDQRRFRRDGSTYIRPPEVIKPPYIQPTKIKLVLPEPYCPEVEELIIEGAKYQSTYSETCPICPLKNYCYRNTKQFDWLVLKKGRDSGRLDYKEIFKRRKVVEYFRALGLTSTGKLNEEQEAEIGSMIKAMMMAVESDRYDLVEDYLEMTFVSWIKMFVGQGW